MEILSVEAIMEEKEELMVPFNGVNIPKLKRAHFLKPNFTFTNGLPSPSLSRTIKLNEAQLKMDFRGRKDPHRGWRKWVEQLQPQYQHIWRKTGIFEAIMASTYKTLRDNDLIIKLAEMWSVETNTFVFPWGEATITLEDIMVLGGYSVLGDSVLVSFETKSLVGKHEYLKRAHKHIRVKRNQPFTTDVEWTEHFMGSQDLSEHEAFLCLWLSRFVFPMKYGVVEAHVFPIALHLSVGTRIALAPAVLASIYRDLSLMKKSMVDDLEVVKVWAPSQLVQLWAWERFPSLGPIPNTLKREEPRAARWFRVQKLKVRDVWNVIRSSAESFRWRPYTTVLENWDPSKFYWENEEFVLVEFSLDTKTDSYVRCLRASELVGMDIVELYLPHRVAMQFGFDQDVPGHVCRSNRSPRIAWNNYIRPITDARLYIPRRLFESDVTTKYVEWWNQRIIMKENAPLDVSTNQLLSKDHIEDGEIVELPSFDDDDEDDMLTITEVLRRRKVRSNGENKVDLSFSTVLNRCDKGDEMSLMEPDDLSTQNQTPIAAECEGENLDKEVNVEIEQENGGLRAANVNEIELEARVENIERIFALIQAGKIVKRQLNWKNWLPTY